jgi:hypothetical protein
MERQLEPFVIDHSIVQDLILGYDILTVCQKFSVNSEYVVELINKSPHFTALTAKHRKSIALARLDALSKAVMSRAANGELSAIHTYLKIQEREARLTGMDSDRGPMPTIKIDIPWLSQDRLAYKRAGEVIENVTDITPIIKVKQAMESAVEPPKD